jgi:hypothetical protein
MRARANRPKCPSFLRAYRFRRIQPKPPGGNIQDFLQTFKEILIEPTVSGRPVILFRIPVLLRLSGLKYDG